MGEPDSYYSSNPIYIVIMRNSRGKMFVYVAVIGVLCFIVFLLSNTHTSLKELEGINEKCQQQRDSLSAQLQVVYEHKNRLEKSLQQEKTDHKHTREGHEKQASELENRFQKEKGDRQKLENHVSQLKTSYAELEEEKSLAENVLKQQLKTVQSQKDTEIEKLQAHLSDLLAEKEKLEVSNNAYAWELKQHASEVDLCQQQQRLTKTELSTCQEQLRIHSRNAIDVKIPSGVIGAKEPAQNLNRPLQADQPALLHAQLQENEIPQGNPLLGHGNEPAKKDDASSANKTVTHHSHPKPEVLQKPHIMPGNNLGDGVLPKPLDLKFEDVNKDIDAALEVPDSKKNEKLADDPLLNHIGENLNEKIYGEPRFEHNAVPQNVQLKDQDNHPQVVAPNFENVGDKDDHAAERGEDGNQYGNLDGKQQLEEPVLGRQHGQPKDLFPVPQPNNDAVAQVDDMMNKSPGEVNNAAEQNVLGMPPHMGPADFKNEFKNENAFMHRGADAHHAVMDDKNYEDDDDDRENDDEPLNGHVHAMKGVNNILQDNDFDDQENQDNDNAKEEGVVVAPK